MPYYSGVTMPSMDGLDTNRKLQTVMEHVMRMDKKIQYVLGNLDEENLSKNIFQSLQGEIQALRERIDAIEEVLQHEPD